MKFKIFGAIFVLVILFLLYVVFNANQSSPDGDNTMGTGEVQQ